jgi:hypothetical protein
MLPNAFRGAVEDASELMQAPPDFLAVSYVVAATAALGLTVSIAPKAKDTSWLVPPVLWGALIGAPSTKKTPALSTGISPLNLIEERLIAEHAEKLKRFDQATASYDHLVKLAKKTGHPMPDKPAEPVAERLLLNDATYQAAGLALQGSPRGVLLSMDELIGWLTSMESSSQEAARAFYLAAWNGTDPYRFDRVGRPSFVINPLAVSVLGGIQPDKLQSYIRAATEGRGNDGLLQRFQLAVYPDQNSEWTLIDRLPNFAARQTAEEAILRLRSLTAPDVAALHTLTGQAYLNFTDEAQQAFNQAYTALERLARSGKLEPIMEAHIGKFSRLIAVLSLVIHLIDGGVGAVSLTAVRKAINWATYLRSHARRIYGGPLSRGTEAAQRLVKKIETSKLSDGFTLRDIQRSGWRGLTATVDVEAGLDVLVTRGWLRGQEPPGVGRPTVTYYINPQVQGMLNQ